MVTKPGRTLTHVMEQSALELYFSIFPTNSKGEMENLGIMLLADVNPAVFPASAWAPFPWYENTPRLSTSK